MNNYKTCRINICILFLKRIKEHGNPSNEKFLWIEIDRTRNILVYTNRGQYCTSKCNIVLTKQYKT